MILSTKGRYAVMAMVDLAAQQSDAPVTLAQIAQRQEIPLAYLEQLVSRLRKAGLVRSVRGPRGGYLLGREAGCISIAEIVEASEESLEMTRCGSSDKEGCVSPKTRCLTHDLWHGLTQHIFEYLSAISLAHVCTGSMPTLALQPHPNLIEVVRA